MNDDEIRPSGIGHLKEITIGGLFDSRNFTFQLDLKEPTLLTGSNGSGKSTILRIINSVGTGVWLKLRNEPFTSITLIFESGTSLKVDKTEENTLRVTLDGERYELNLNQADIDWDDSDIARLLPDLHRAPSGRFMDDFGSHFSREEVAEKIFMLGFSGLSEQTQPLAQFVEDFNLLYITDQRLVVAEERITTLQRSRITRAGNRIAAEMSARELARQIQRTLSEYASQSQRLDRDFPQRVVSAMAKASEEEIPVGRIEALLRDVDRDREQLQKVGLLPRDLSADAFRDLSLNEPYVRPVIETFVTDTKKKFAVLADLRERMTLFTDFLNQHYENKRVIATAKDGFRVEIDGEREKAILPSQLSSGEQQILVLAYEVLFRSEPGTLVLIDEPELSLHVIWQDTFVDDLARMGSVRDLQFILATHSPSLIGGREDLRRSLDSLHG